MVIQFGFVTMFVAAFPLAPLFALINNILELRIDAINFAVNFRRPVAERAQGIGVWFDILRTMSWFAVLANSFVIAFTSEFIPRYKEYFDSVEPYDFNRQYFFVLAVRLGFVIIFQYFVFFTVGFLDWLIPDVPRKLEVKIKRENYVARECLTRSEAEASHDLDARVSGTGGSANSLYISCENVNNRSKNPSIAGSKLGVNRT
ncbi:Anoctamin-4 [Desmophyllum pertusum]|uniref:Anoctamin n=1 Tax=Desmophyllum pertusum TaxID=174260 RepID=A0A9W9YGJ8_9CNID|nr:Anoctamin-4 [Desmophyllum pertusum]